MTKLLSIKKKMSSSKFYKSFMILKYLLILIFCSFPVSAQSTTLSQIA